MRERPARVPASPGTLGTRAGPLDLRFVPGLGGKVTGLRLGPDGREWLARPVRPLRAPRPGQDWGELDCSGWDECLPNIGASPDGTLADHGDVWRLPWQARTGPDTLSGSVAPPHRGYRFARELVARGPVLRAEYWLDNLGDRPLPWAWAQHMLLAGDEHSRILSSSPMRLRLDSAYRNGAAESGGTGRRCPDWLCPGGEPTTGISLRGAAGRAAKLWFEPPLPAVVAVLHGQEWLAWHLTERSFPDLGLWVNLGGWGDPGLRQLAVEPAFGARDAPADAYPELVPLGPGECRGWRTVVEAGVGARALDLLLSSATGP
ncbi:hypothetical protein EDD99_5601 [Streptomyces sp. 846.5]|nr:hypothetical protein [Streptomyces sp. 846.5]TDT97463.1 hypothetical protein EDD99_5601 [Streptomyces sp. 846.5]